MLSQLSKEYISDRVDVSPSGCWLWRLQKNSQGYAMAGDKSGTYRVHRLTYELYVDKIPKGLVIDHLCGVTSCVNLKHLEPVSQKENVMRGKGVTAVNAARKVCMREHPLDGDNLYIAPKSGYRQCKTCKASRRRKYAAIQAERAKLKEVK